MARLDKLQTHILVCNHKKCLKAGAREVKRELLDTLKEHGLRRQVMVTNVDCLDQCSRAPMVCVYPDGIWYKEVDEAAARAIIEQRYGRGDSLKRHILRDAAEGSDDTQKDEDEEVKAN